MKQTKDSLKIVASDKFSENPETVLIFTHNKKFSNAQTNSQKKDTSLKNSRPKGIVVFSREDFFYKEIINLFSDSFYNSKSGEMFSIYKQGRYHQIVYLGVGDHETTGNPTKKRSIEQKLEQLRMSLGQLRDTLTIQKSLEVDLTEIKNMSDFLNIEIPLLLEAICDGLLLGGHKSKQYTANFAEPTLKSISFVCPDHLDLIQKVANERLPICQASLLARDLINEPPNLLNVDSFVKKAKDLARKNGVQFDMLNKRQMRQKQMNGILAVNAGSEEEAKLIFLNYTPNAASKKNRRVLVVGKGVLFDSGGLSLKPSKSMEEMKMDMSGAAIALASILAVAQLKLPLSWTVALPLTDNMPSSKATKVGSVVTMHNGKTVEILNTDAEGRLILADALSYSIEKYQPDYVIDIATLTGAVMVALGQEYAGLFSNDDQLAEMLIQSGKISGEKVWPMPLDDCYQKSLESTIADLKNIGGPYAGATTAAKFLENFVGTAKWAHLDIAGVMSQTTRHGYYSEGARAVGVRILCDFAKRYCLQK